LLCESKKDLQTHHIKEQHNARSGLSSTGSHQNGKHNKFIDDVHMNSSQNLVALCEKCHENLHRNKQKIVYEIAHSAESGGESFRYNVIPE